MTHFDLSVARRSPHLRATAFAALGAAEVLTRHPDHAGARSLLADAAGIIAERTPRSGPWPWPEPRLRYANATLPEVLLAAGSLLGDPSALELGLAMLGWLLDIETAGDHLSITPVGGWVTGESRPGFDQQPIEVAALADACCPRVRGHRGSAVAEPACSAARPGSSVRTTPASAWSTDVTGGGCDGLHRTGRNENQGAESTLAMISTFQLVPASRDRDDDRPPPTGLPRPAGRPQPGDRQALPARPGDPGQRHLPRGPGDSSGAGHEGRPGDPHAHRHHGPLRRPARRPPGYPPQPLRTGSPPATRRFGGLRRPGCADRRVLHPGVLDRGGGALQPVDGRPSRPVRSRAGRAAVRDERPRRRRGTCLEHRVPHRRPDRRRGRPAR